MSSCSCPLDLETSPTSNRIHLFLTECFAHVRTLFEPLASQRQPKLSDNRLNRHTNMQ